MNINDFEFIRSLNWGAYGEVLLVRLKSNEKKFFALKIIDWSFLVRNNNQY